MLVHKSGFHNQTETVEITADKPSVFLKLNLFLLTPKIDIDDELMEEEEFLDTTDSDSSVTNESDFNLSDEEEETDSTGESESSNSVLSEVPILENEEYSDRIEAQERIEEKESDIESDDDASWENENSSSFINVLVYGVTFLGFSFCLVIFLKKRAPSSGAGTFQFNKIGVQDDIELRKSLLKNRV